MKPLVAMALAPLFALVAAPLQAGETVDPGAHQVVACHSEPDPATAPDLRALCALLREELDASPVSELAIVVETFRPNFLRAHLQWQTGDNTHQGRSVDFGFVDTTFGSSQYRFVVTGLLEAANLPAADTTSP